MPFIPPTLATRLEDPRRLADPRYSAEPKLDGQRAQLHVREHRTVHAFNHPGRELIRLAGLAWLREIRWPIASAIIDGEAVAGDGSEGIQAVFGARHRPRSPMAFAAFDLLQPALEQSLPGRRDCFGPLDQDCREGLDRPILSKEAVEQLERTLGRKRIEPELGVRGLAATAVLVLGPVVDEEQEPRRRQAFDEAVQQRLGLGVDPVEVLEDHHERLDLSLA
jgi:hypothetical protein